jgi:processive 1,2-diacylglycerol beta-glucosyltransferase
VSVKNVMSVMSRLREPVTRTFRRSGRAVDSGATIRAAHEPAPRVLILSASVGSGHVRAASAIEQSLSLLLPDAEIAHVDVLELTNAGFRRCYGKGYFEAVAAAPHVVRLMYDLLDRPGSSGVTGGVRRWFERANFTRLQRLVCNGRWDLVICTHFLPAGVTAWLRRTGRTDAALATVVTDFEVHGLWIQEPCDAYFVATREARVLLASRGVDPAIVLASGIPIDPVFEVCKDREACAREHGLDPERRTVLQMAGGLGVGSIEATYRSILAVQAPLQVCVVTGKNEAARERLARVAVPARHTSRLVGFTRQVDELMAAADVVVSKPGGLTTSETLARGCAMVVVDPIPGQEERNSDYLLEQGCAVKVNHLATLNCKLEALLSDPGRLGAMRAAARRAARPRAAADVAEGCAGLLDLKRVRRI